MEEDAPRLGVVRDLVGFHVRRVSSVIAGDFKRTMAATGMRPVLFGILSVIDANPGISQGGVGQALGIQRANMVSLVNDLVDRGLVRREIAAEDRRAFALTLTAAGSSMIDESLIRIRAHEDMLMSDLSEAERSTLILLLDRIAAKDDPRRRDRIEVR